MVVITTKKGVGRTRKYLGILIQLIGDVIDDEVERLEFVILLKGNAQKLGRIVINRSSRFHVAVIRA